MLKYGNYMVVTK